MSRAIFFAGLIYEPRGSNVPAETKKGMLLDNGTAAGSETWAYRINVKLGALYSAKDRDENRQKLNEYGAHVIQGFSDNALLVAMDFGTERLNSQTDSKPWSISCVLQSVSRRTTRSRSCTAWVR